MENGELDFQMHPYSQLRHPVNSKVGTVTVISYLKPRLFSGDPDFKRSKKLIKQKQKPRVYVVMIIKIVDTNCRKPGILVKNKDNDYSSPIPQR